MTTFKAPQLLPQDLLLISELVDVPQQGPLQSTYPKGDIEDDIASSSSDSEEEIEKDLLEDESDAPSDSSLSSDSSDSDSEHQGETQPTPRQKASTPDFDEDEVAGPSNATTLPQTKNEVADSIITIPELEKVESDEELEKVGEVMSLVGNVVIVRGSPSQYLNRGSDKVLDSDTLLVFEDRTVMGYIYETFGPTAQPFYQVKFNQTYPLDPEKVKIGREVFHIPRRSHFVFVNQLRHLKGSDASNLHDEEPAEDEVEFSDDEAEAAHRRRLKRKRNDGRARSMSSSRRSTPVPSQLRDQDMMNEIWNQNDVDVKGPYDIDYGAGPSRPAPRPYDDPYSDAYESVKHETSVGPSTSRPRLQIERPRLSSSRARGFSRGRGRGRGRQDNINTHQISGRDIHPLPQLNAPGMKSEEYDPRMPYEAPPSLYPQDPSWLYPSTQGFNQFHNQSYMFPGSSYPQPYASPSAFVQPHINPRFASAFGLQMSPTIPSHVPSTSTYAQVPTTSVEPVMASSQQDLSRQWPMPMTEPTVPSHEDQWSAPTVNSTVPKDEERET